MTYGVIREWRGTMAEGGLADDVFNFWAQTLKGEARKQGALMDGEYKGAAKRGLTGVEMGRFPRLPATLTDPFRMGGP